MSGVGERQVTGGNGRGPSGRKVLLSLVMEGFWLRDKCRIRAEICYQPTIGWLIKPLPGYIVQIMGSTLSGLRIAAALTGSPGPAPARKRG